MDEIRFPKPDEYRGCKLYYQIEIDSWKRRFAKRISESDLEVGEIKDILEMIE